MIKPIDSLIASTFEYKVDMLGNLSLSSNASMIKYALAYKDFNLHENYSYITETTFVPTFEWWGKKCKGYLEQDQKSQRNTSNNVTTKDYKKICELIANSVCVLCKEGFTFENKPTLDRIDNKKGHSLDNCQLTYASCIAVKSQSRINN